MESKRESFIFYRSFMEALAELNDTQYAKVFRAITKFALDGKEIKLTGIEKVIFQLIKPQLIANQKRYENGCKGGRKQTKTEPNDNQNGTEIKPNDNVNDNDNVNVIKVSKKESKEDIFKNNTTHVRESYDDIIKGMEFSNVVSLKIGEFIKHCLANGHVLINSELEGMLVKLDFDYQTDEDKIRALNDAIKFGYFGLKEGA